MVQPRRKNDHSLGPQARNLFDNRRIAQAAYISGGTQGWHAAVSGELSGNDPGLLESRIKPSGVRIPPYQGRSGSAFWTVRFKWCTCSQPAAKNTSVAFKIVLHQRQDISQFLREACWNASVRENECRKTGQYDCDCNRSRSAPSLEVSEADRSLDEAVSQPG